MGWISPSTRVKSTASSGSNGAGKTTTMRIALGILSADSGEVLQDGKTLTFADRQRFGYMPEERGLYPKMKVGEQLIYFAKLPGLSDADPPSHGVLDRTPRRSHAPRR